MTALDPDKKGLGSEPWPLGTSLWLSSVVHLPIGSTWDNEVTFTVPLDPVLGTRALGFPAQIAKLAFRVFPGLFPGSVFLGAYDATTLHTPGLRKGQGALLLLLLLLLLFLT